jgi:hypothetical protein
MSDVTEFDGRFGSNAAAPAVPQRAGQATMVEQARAIAEVRAAVMIAMDRPRDRTAAITEMREVCGIPALAERAFFRVPRGGEHVNGESIHLARELARCWGNLAFGVKELARDDIKGQSELLAFAWDLQTNARSEITFIVPHTRGKGKRLTGTQEIYENNASFAGRRLRETIFAVLPVWFKAEAAEICHRTLADGGGKPLVQRIADLRTAFEAVGVGAAQLERKRGRKIDDFLPEDVAGLRVVYGSIKRGEVTVAEEFPSSEPNTTPPPTGDKLGTLEAAIVPGPVKPDDDPFGLPPLTEQPSPHDAAERAPSAAAPSRLDGRGPEPSTPEETADLLGDRDPAFWNRRDGKRVIDARDRAAFMAEVQQRLGECRSWAETEDIERHNAAAIRGLDAGLRTKVAELLAARREQVRGEKSADA